MRFITRELYRAIQPDSGVPEEEADREWSARCEALSAHLKSIRPALPEGVGRLLDAGFHDTVVQSAAQVGLSDVVLLVDSRTNPWGARGLFEVVFRGVKHVCGLDEIVGDQWLYDEADWHPQAGFAFGVLLARSEFNVVADDVELREHLVTSAP